jgi:hypothetical protein
MATTWNPGKKWKLVPNGKWQKVEMLLMNRLYFVDDFPYVHDMLTIFFPM